jgi:hypothetical protein
MDIGGLPITEYSIYQNYNWNNPLHTGQLTTGTVSRLSPGTSYNFTVRAKNALGLSRREGLQLKSAETKIRRTFPLQIRPFSSTRAHLIITPPNNETGFIYICMYSPEANASESMNTSQHYFTLDRLTPDTTYSITCLIYKDGGEDLCYEGTATGSTFPRGL